MRAVAATAVADFRERTRRQSYVVIVAAAVLLGYLTLPPADSQWTIVDLGGYRGLYNSTYVGTATALAGGLWLMLGGFYVVRGTVTRDQRTGVGELLAASPLSRVGYLRGEVRQQLAGAHLDGRCARRDSVVYRSPRQRVRTVDPLERCSRRTSADRAVLAMTAAAACFSTRSRVCVPVSATLCGSSVGWSRRSPVGELLWGRAGTGEGLDA